MNKKIDLVYLWVDGSDEKWAEKKANALAKYKGIALNKDTVASCRFLQNDELKYSLRSVEKYASWINHIYIVTDNQVPKWLNLDNPKITIVNQNEIMPSKFLPCFNSCAIETHIKIFRMIFCMQMMICFFGIRFHQVSFLMKKIVLFV